METAAVKICAQKQFTHTKTFYVHKIAAKNLSKIYFLNNLKKISKPNNRDVSQMN